MPKESGIEWRDKSLIFIRKFQIHGKEFAEFFVAFCQDVIVDAKTGNDIMFVVDDRDLEALFE